MFSCAFNTMDHRFAFRGAKLLVIMVIMTIPTKVDKGKALASAVSYCLNVNNKRLVCLHIKK